MSTTDNYDFTLVADGDTSWGDAERANWAKVDGELLARIRKISGGTSGNLVQIASDGSISDAGIAADSIERKVTFSAAAQLTNYVDITVQTVDLNDDSVAGYFLQHIWLSDTQYGIETIATPDDFEVRIGVQLEAITAAERLHVITDSAGKSVVRITNVVGEDWWVNCEVQGKIWTTAAAIAVASTTTTVAPTTTAAATTTATATTTVAATTTAAATTTIAATTAAATTTAAVTTTPTPTTTTPATTTPTPTTTAPVTTTPTPTTTSPATTTAAATTEPPIPVTTTAVPVTTTIPATTEGATTTGGPTTTEPPIPTTTQPCGCECEADCACECEAECECEADCGCECEAP